MIETDKNRVIVTERPIREDLKLWLSAQDDFKLTIADDQEPAGPPVNDAVILLGGRRQTDVEQVEVLKTGSANRHRNWYNAGKDLRDWSNGNFHMGDPLIMATWLSGKAGASEILFAEVKPEDRIDMKYNKKRWRDVMGKLVSEFGVELYYTDLRSQLLKEVGGEKMENFMEEPEVANIELPSRDSPFANRESGRKTVIKHENGAVGPTVIHGSEWMTATDVIPNDASRIPQSSLFILRPDDNELLKKAIATGKDVYLINEEISEELTNQSSVLTQTVISFVMGGEEVKTNGIIGRVSDSEKEFLEGIAKNNENLTHV